jgi:hypothetical protein
MPANTCWSTMRWTWRGSSRAPGAAVAVVRVELLAAGSGRADGPAGRAEGPALHPRQPAAAGRCRPPAMPCACGRSC